MGFWVDNLFLNVTVVAATLIFLLTVLSFSYKMYHNRRRIHSIAQKNASITSQNKDVDPNDDNDPTRPMAILLIQESSGKKFYAGNKELYSKLHIMSEEVMSSLDGLEKKDLFQNKPHS